MLRCTSVEPDRIICRAFLIRPLASTCPINWNGEAVGFLCWFRSAGVGKSPLSSWLYGIERGLRDYSSGWRGLGDTGCRSTIMVVAADL